MKAHVLLNLFNELRQKMLGLPTILYLFTTSLISQYTGAQMFDSIYHMTLN